VSIKLGFARRTHKGDHYIDNVESYQHQSDFGRHQSHFESRFGSAGSLSVRDLRHAGFGHDSISSFSPSWDEDTIVFKGPFTSFEQVEAASELITYYTPMGPIYSLRITFDANSVLITYNDVSSLLLKGWDLQFMHMNPLLFSYGFEFQNA